MNSENMPITIVLCVIIICASMCTIKEEEIKASKNDCECKCK